MAEQIVTPRTRRRPKPRTGAATLREVADAAGVSTASVSRALTRASLVSDSLRARVLAAAANVGYVANPAARALATRRSGLVGLVLAATVDSSTVLALDAMQRRLAAAGIGLLVTIADGAADASAHADALATRGADAIVFAGVGRSAAEPGEWASIPWLRLDAAAADRGVPLPGIDRRRATVLAARYLKELGHRHIGLIAEEIAGDGEAVRELLAPEQIELVTFSVAAGSDAMMARDACRALLSHRANITGVIGASDLIATVVVCEAAAQGISIPGALSVVGFGDTELSRVVRPGLTSVRVPARATGIAAADYLLSVFAGRPPTELVLPGPKLAVRESTGPCPARS